MKPASDPTVRGLAESEMQAFVRDGFVKLSGFVAPDLVRSAKRAINISVGEGIDPAQLSRLRVTSFCPELRSDPALMALLEDSGLWTLGETLLGQGNLAPGSLGNAQINLRFPVECGNVGPIVAHLDGMASRTNKVPTGTLQSFSALIGVMLSDIDASNAGNFSVWPGSHVKNAAALKSSGAQAILEGMPDIALDDPVQLTGQPGDVFLCHYLLSHGTAPNWSAEVRYMVFFRLVRKAHEAEKWDSLTRPWMQWPGLSQIVRDQNEMPALPFQPPQTQERSSSETAQALQPQRRKSTDLGPVCGLKLTHDGAVAIIEDGKLIFSTEIEKIDNNPRFSAVGHSGRIRDALGAFGYTPQAIRAFVIDGWGIDPSREQRTLGHEEASAYVRLKDNGTQYELAVARYREESAQADLTRMRGFEGLPLGGARFNYLSSYHVTGHILGAYATSERAKANADSYVLVWDGGMFPSLYHLRAQARRIESLGPLFRYFGNAYAQFAGQFAPFDEENQDDLGIAGKVMAYVALGESRSEILGRLKVFGKSMNDGYYDFPRRLAERVRMECADAGFKEADYLRSFHDYLCGLLCATLEMQFAKRPRSERHLCIAGGCALNIKWNSAIRSLGLFSSIHIPPFPNDCGSAIGAALAYGFSKGAPLALDWSVYSGPRLRDREPVGWNRRQCSTEDLAALLHLSQEPIVVLNGRAEIGPRALGNRCVLAAASSPQMKAILNRIKQRADYRPVAPICLEADAPEIFDPGTPDPFMLFEHRVRPEWRERIPSAVHLDGSARLQTVRAEDNPVIASLLEAYKAKSGIPLLCNTSANLRGSGFFPDAASACDWGMTNHVWCEGELYTNPVPVDVSASFFRPSE